ncbi:MAG: hypothetical protein ABW148_00920 [Sedimenticola sp.]
MRRRDGGQDTVLREDYVGCSAERICYPGIISCVSVTGILPGKLIGTHLTISTKIEMVDELFQAMKDDGGSGCVNFYVIGAFKHFMRADKAINTGQKLSNKIKSRINRNSTIKFYDTSLHRNVHVFAEKSNSVTSFYWIKSKGNTVSMFNYPDPMFLKRDKIFKNEFIVL